MPQAGCRQHQSDLPAASLFALPGSGVAFRLDFGLSSVLCVSAFLAFGTWTVPRGTGGVRLN